MNQSYSLNGSSNAAALSVLWQLAIVVATRLTKCTYGLVAPVLQNVEFTAHPRLKHANRHRILALNGRDQHALWNTNG